MNYARHRKTSSRYSSRNAFSGSGVRRMARPAGRFAAVNYIRKRFRTYFDLHMGTAMCHRMACKHYLPQRNSPDAAVTNRRFPVCSRNIVLICTRKILSMREKEEKNRINPGSKNVKNHARSKHVNLADSMTCHGITIACARWSSLKRR